MEKIYMKNLLLISVMAIGFRSNASGLIKCDGVQDKKTVIFEIDSQKNEIKLKDSFQKWAMTAPYSLNKGYLQVNGTEVVMTTGRRGEISIKATQSAVGQLFTGVASIIPTTSRVMAVPAIAIAVVCQFQR